MLPCPRSVYKEADGIPVPGDNRSPELIVSLIHSVTIPEALASVITIARWVAGLFRSGAPLALAAIFPTHTCTHHT